MSTDDKAAWPFNDTLRLDIPLPGRTAPTAAEGAVSLTLSDVVATKAITPDHVTLEAEKNGSRFGIRIERDRVLVFLAVEGQYQVLPEATAGRNLVAHVRGLLLPRPR